MRRRNTTKSPVILLAEDDKEMRSLLAQALHSAHYSVSECVDGWNLVEHLRSFILPDSREHDQIDLMISDIRMPGLTAFEILEGVEDTDGFPPLIRITAFGDEETHVQAEKFGVAAIFDKPFEIDDLATGLGRGGLLITAIRCINAGGRILRLPAILTAKR